MVALGGLPARAAERTKNISGHGTDSDSHLPRSGDLQVAPHSPLSSFPSPKPCNLLSVQ